MTVTTDQINVEIYDQLGEHWYEAKDDPIALLRAESRHRNPWVLRKIREHQTSKELRVLDMACGAGFLSNWLAAKDPNLEVHGVDQSEPSLSVARRHDSSGRVSYAVMDALALDFEDQSFDIVCAMDFLEHVEDPAALVREISRVLKPGGIFFFHTFNRNWLSKLIVIYGVEWVLPKTPADLHLYRLFIRPNELQEHMSQSGLSGGELLGVGPKVLSLAFLRLLFRGVVGDDFEFSFVPSRVIGYTGWARKGEEWPVGEQLER